MLELQLVSYVQYEVVADMVLEVSFEEMVMGMPQTFEVVAVPLDLNFVVVVVALEVYHFVN